MFDSVSTGAIAGPDACDANVVLLIVMCSFTGLLLRCYSFLVVVLKIKKKHIIHIVTDGLTFVLFDIMIFVSLFMSYFFKAFDLYPTLKLKKVLECNYSSS